MDEGRRKSRREKLAEFYGDGGESAAANPCDINGPAFDPEVYMGRLVKEATLSQLMAKESDVVKEIHSLDSDMQTLVYENYNKFIAATDTVNRMRVDFKDTDADMQQLADKMQVIAERSARVTETMRERRERTAELSATHCLLKKLQFLFELPSKLKDCIGRGDYGLGVKYYARAQKVLRQYEHLQSFSGIKADCDDIIVRLRSCLLGRLGDADASPAEMSESVNLLLSLNEDPPSVCDAYLDTSAKKLSRSLEVLCRQVSLAESAEPFEAATMDMLEFTDAACNGFLSDTCLIVAAYNDTFGKVEPAAGQKLDAFLTRQVTEQFFNIVRRRARCERSLADVPVTIRSLDRYYRRIQALCRLLPAESSETFTLPAVDLILDISKDVCRRCLDSLKRSLNDELAEARRKLVLPSFDLLELNSTLLSVLGNEFKDRVSSLRYFTDPELTFSVNSYYRLSFCRVVRDDVALGFFDYFLATVNDLDRSPPLTALLLLLSRSCSDINVQQLLNVVDESFNIEDVVELGKKVRTEMKSTAQKLLNSYVQKQGQLVSTMLRKSVETRDWLNTVEPRTVRAVMKRVVEEITSIDRQVGDLYEEGPRKTRSSDSSRFRRSQAGRSWSTANATSIASNIQRMFVEKIEVFSPVEFSRVSILTGVVKISLKTLLECIRLKTFSRFGFQQVQVDTHYLSLYLWRFVSDENLVTFLLDEIMTSAVHRSLDPIPMEPSVVEIICDRN